MVVEVARGETKCLLAVRMNRSLKTLLHSCIATEIERLRIRRSKYAVSILVLDPMFAKQRSGNSIATVRSA